MEVKIYPTEESVEDEVDKMDKVDIYGCIRLVFFVLRHPIATYRFIRDARCAFRSCTTDVYGNTAPLWSNPEIKTGFYSNRLRKDE